MAIALATHCADRAAAGDFECPDQVIVDQGLYHRDSTGNWAALSGDADGAAAIKLDEHLRFFYAIDSARAGNVPGSILVKRVYNLTGPWRDRPVDVRMRRNDREEIPAAADVYSAYHEETWRKNPDSIRRRFHITNSGRHRTDDTNLRGVFLFDKALLASELHVTKPLIIHYNGFGDQQFICLDFDLNENAAAYNWIDMEIYELRSDDDAAPDAIIDIRLNQLAAVPADPAEPASEDAATPTG